MEPLMVTIEQLKSGAIRLEFGNPDQIAAIKREEERIRKKNEECESCEGRRCIECPECNGDGEIECPDCV